MRNERLLTFISVENSYVNRLFHSCCKLVKIKNMLIVCRLHYKCPKIVQNETGGMCYWDLKTDPHYRLPYEYYYFTLSARNALGNWSKLIKFHHYSHGKC
jgi:hypothetical protein